MKRKSDWGIGMIAKDRRGRDKVDRIKTIEMEVARIYIFEERQGHAGGSGQPMLQS